MRRALLFDGLHSGGPGAPEQARTAGPEAQAAPARGPNQPTSTVQGFGRVLSGFWARAAGPAARLGAGRGGGAGASRSVSGLYRRGSSTATQARRNTTSDSSGLSSNVTRADPSRPPPTPGRSACARAGGAVRLSTRARCGVPQLWRTSMRACLARASYPRRACSRSVCRRRWKRLARCSPAGHHDQNHGKSQVQRHSRHAGARQRRRARLFYDAADAGDGAHGRALELGRLQLAGEHAADKRGAVRDLERRADQLELLDHRGRRVEAQHGARRRDSPALPAAAQGPTVFSWELRVCRRRMRQRAARALGPPELARAMRGRPGARQRMDRQRSRGGTRGQALAGGRACWSAASDWMASWPGGRALADGRAC
jgi:hypothetical protein